MKALDPRRQKIIIDFNVHGGTPNFFQYGQTGHISIEKR